MHRNNVVVLKEFFGKKEFGANNKRKYWIQLATEEYFDDIIKELSTGFVAEEPLCKYADLGGCKESLDFMIELCKTFLRKNTTLLCLTTSNLEKKPRFVGVNVTYFVKKNDPENSEIIGEISKKICYLLDYVKSLSDPFLTLDGCDEYLYAMGLYVLPEFRGEGVGLELLKARETLCKMYNVRFTCTIFTSIVSQVLAESAGFKNLIVISYEDLFKRKPEFLIKNISEQTKCCKFMYCEYKK